VSPAATRKSRRTLVDAALAQNEGGKRLGARLVLCCVSQHAIRREHCIGVDPSPPARNRIRAAKSVSKLAETQAEGQDLVVIVRE
jgi:hypothetical protein